MGVKCFLLVFTGLVPSALTEECLSVLTSPRTEVSLLILGGHLRGVWCGRNLLSGPCPLRSFLPGMMVCRAWPGIAQVLLLSHPRPLLAGLASLLEHSSRKPLWLATSPLGMWVSPQSWKCQGGLMLSWDLSAAGPRASSSSSPSRVFAVLAASSGKSGGQSLVHKWNILVIFSLKSG